MSEDTRYRIGVDIGGTFTDFVIASENGDVVVWKEDTTPVEPERAVLAGFEAVASLLGTTGEKLLQASDLLVHGTTVATNMLIERDGPRVGLLCTDGFRDVLYFRDGYKPERFNLHLPHPDELVDRWLRLGIPGRFMADGTEVTPLDEAAVRAAARRFREAGVTTVAIAFLWSVLYPRHELRAAEILREEMGGLDVVCSHEVLPEMREWERSSAAAMSAYILPRVRDYLGRLETNIAKRGFAPPLLVMQVNGGCARVPDLIRVPVNIVASGPAAAPAAARRFADTAGDDAIVIDMGGTSLDVCLIEDGRPVMSRDFRIDDQPIGVAAVDVHSIGAGGGSVAWIDSGGALRVGPQSAGSRPGPVAYDHGGLEPTVTDANIALGYLPSDAFLGGRRRLRDDLARDAIRDRIAGPLGLDPIAAAAGIIEVVNANMVGAIRAISVDRGIDPRRFQLISGGGAGGLHAVELARSLGMSAVFVPREASVLCAFGMTVTDVRHDYAQALYGVTSTIDRHAIDELYDRLEREAVEQLREEGFGRDEIRLERSVDARYAGQVHEITVPFPDGSSTTEEMLRTLEDSFHRQHEAQFAYARAGMAVECLHWRLAAVGVSRPAAASSSAEREAADRDVEPVREQLAYDQASRALVATPVYEERDLTLGASVAGPAIIVDPATTLLLHAGDVASRVTADGLRVDVAARGGSDAAPPARNGSVGADAREPSVER